MSRARIGVIAAYAGTVLIWGTTWLAIKYALLGLPPVTSAGLRFALAGGLLSIVALIAGVDFRKDRAPLHLIAVLAFAMFGLNYALTYFAETHLASGLVAVLFGTQPFFTFAFAYALFREATGPFAVFGAMLALAGVALISWSGNVQGGLLYVVATVTAAALSAFATVYLKKFSQYAPLATLPPAMLLSGAGMLASGALFERPHWPDALIPAALAATLYLAVFGSAIAFYLTHWLLQRISSGAVGLTAFAVPVIAVAVGSLLAGERFAVRELFGAVLVLAGLWLALTRTASSTRAGELESAA